ncbi:MAG: hypothetical protein ACHP7N_00865 [Caulobacterales bacterium]
MDSLTDPAKFKQRELVVRVATLELLVADLIHLVRQLAPEAVEAVAAEAAHDLENQIGHGMPDGLEHQRFRLQQVLDSRARNLGRKRFSSRFATQRFSSTD